ncbi:MAG: hypothetical protein ACI4BA_09610 [Prevotella sp.]
MKREDKWFDCYEMISAFVKKNHRGPSRHRLEEHQMLNWMKYNRKRLNCDKLSEDEKVCFLRLMDLIRSFHRVNQYC